MDAGIRGNLVSFSLPQVLLFLRDTHKSGCLTVFKPQREAHIYLEDGSIVYATSNLEKFRLGAVLLRKKKIDEVQRLKIEEMMLLQGEKFGRIMVEQKLITEEELRDYLKIQASEIIYDSFVWSDGAFSYAEDATLPQHAVRISIDLTNIIMEGARRISEFQHFSGLLPNKSMILRVIGKPEMQNKISLTLDEWKILFLIDGKRTLEQICGESADDPSDVYRLIYGLYANKIVEEVPEQELLQLVIRQAEESSVNIPSDLEQQTTQNVIDDTELLVSADANLCFKDVLKVTLARLIWRKSDIQQEIFPLIEQEYFVGRQPGCQIHIADPSISNTHARIFKGPEGYVLEDLNSRNGSFVNGERINRKLLQENDAIQLGNSSLIYNIVCEVQRVQGTASQETLPST